MSLGRSPGSLRRLAIGGAVVVAGLGAGAGIAAAATSGSQAAASSGSSGGSASTATSTASPKSSPSPSATSPGRHGSPPRTRNCEHKGSQGPVGSSASASGYFG